MAPCPPATTTPSRGPITPVSLALVKIWYVSVPRPEGKSTVVVARTLPPAMSTWTTLRGRTGGPSSVISREMKACSSNASTEV